MDPPATVQHSPAVTISPTAEDPTITSERGADTALTTALQQPPPPPRHTRTDRPLPSPSTPPPFPQRSAPPLGGHLRPHSLRAQLSLRPPQSPALPPSAPPRAAAAEQRTAAAVASLRAPSPSRAVQTPPLHPPPFFLNRITLFLYPSADRKSPLCLGLKLHERRLKFCKELRKK